MKLKLVKLMLANLPDDCDLNIEQTDSYKVMLVLEDMESNKVTIGPIDFEPIQETT